MLQAKSLSVNEKGIVAVTGRAHCQRQVAFFRLDLDQLLV